LKATISSLRMRIRNCWNDLHSFLDAVVNQLNCYPDLQGPKQIGNRFDARLSFCETLHVACNLSSFLAERRNELQQVLGLISGAPADEETKRRIAAIGSALEDFSALEDPSRERREVCWDLGDLLVCLEAPEGADILNDNARHMDPICTGLGKNSVHWR
jgi:hypothetical protein